MAVNRLPSGRFQVKVRGSDGKWVTGTFDDVRSAKQGEALLKSHLLGGGVVTGSGNRVTVDEYFREWFELMQSSVSKGWRTEQAKRYERYIAPAIGSWKMRDVTPALIGSILNGGRKAGLAEQTCLHLYALLHKMFGDAVELFQCIPQSPVIRTLRPKPPEREAKHLTVEQAVRLLQHVDGKPFELAVWLGLYMGLRAGEIQALKWENIDLDRGFIHIRATYVRKEDRIRDYPKGKKWHSHQLPPELLARLKLAKQTAVSDFVVTSPRREMLNYSGFRAALKRYCKEAGIPIVVAHGLRHSTAAIYMANGATRDDLRKLFRHSASSVTDRYIHDPGERVDGIARVIQLFPGVANGERLTSEPCSTNVPRDPKIAVEQSS